VKQMPLFHGAAAEAQPADAKDATHGKSKIRASKTLALEANGRRAWLAIDECVILTEQHRFSDATEDGSKLHDIVQKLSSDAEKGLSTPEVEDLCATLNACVASKEKIGEMLRSGVTVVALRNAVKAKLSLLLARHDAYARKERLIVWANPHFAAAERTTGKTKRSKGPPLASRPMTDAVHRVLAGVTHTGKTNVMPAVQYFYNGVRYNFMDSKHPAVNWVTNNVCIGRKLILNPLEPDDDLSKPYRILRYLPIAIYVEPNGLPLGDLCGEGCPTNCIPITPTRSSQISVDFPHEVMIHPSSPAEGGRDARHSVIGTKVAVYRHGFMLESANVVTDYFAQGMSFRGTPNLLHITPPPGQGQRLNRGNILVTVSRPSLLSELNLLTRLWREGDDADKARVIGAVKAALIPSKDYLAEKVRLHALSVATWEHHYERLCSSTLPNKLVLASPSLMTPTPKTPVHPPIARMRPAVETSSKAKTVHHIGQGRAFGSCKERAQGRPCVHAPHIDSEPRLEIHPRQAVASLQINRLYDQHTAMMGSRNMADIVVSDSSSGSASSSGSGSGSDFDNTDPSSSAPAASTLDSASCSDSGSVPCLSSEPVPHIASRMDLASDSCCKPESSSHRMMIHAGTTHNNRRMRPSQMMNAYGRIDPGGGSTLGDGDCGVRAVLQSRFKLQTPDAPDDAMNAWVETNIVNTRRSLADTISSTPFLLTILSTDLPMTLSGKGALLKYANSCARMID
jgi:hypothetical protein